MLGPVLADPALLSKVVCYSPRGFSLPIDAIPESQKHG